jgi:hypothetical protein
MKGMRDRIAERIPELKYVDKDWGQLYAGPPPAVSFPCALVDVAGIDFTAMHGGRQRARGTFSVTVANLRTGSGSARSPQKDDAFKTVELLQGVHNALHMWNGEGNWTPLIRTSLQKMASDMSGLE